MMIRPPLRRRSPRPGAALLEFVAVLPLYVILIIGIWEGGRLFYVMQICSNAAREGARLAARGDASIDPYTSQPLSSPANIRATIINYIRNADPSINTTGITIEIKKVDPPGTGGEIPGSGDIDPSDRSLAETNPLRVLQLDHLRVRVVIPYNNFRWTTHLPQLLNKNEVRSVVDVRCLLDQPFTLDPTVPQW